MAKHLNIANQADKKEKYDTLLSQIAALTADEPDIIANMANIAAAVHATFGFFWVGFYRVVNDELVLGPFHGPIACTRIRYGKGVCGTAWKEQRTVIVDDVNLFPGHIACNAASRSEIVIPVFRNEKVIAVLDVDSEHLSHFDDTDAVYLQKIVQSLQ